MLLYFTCRGIKATVLHLLTLYDLLVTHPTKLIAANHRKSILLAINFQLMGLGTHIAGYFTLLCL